jgi:hypothetical protein
MLAVSASGVEFIAVARAADYERSRRDDCERKRTSRVEVAGMKDPEAHDHHTHEMHWF